MEIDLIKYYHLIFFLQLSNPISRSQDIWQTKSACGLAKHSWSNLSGTADRIA